ncbi:transporter substrate-binding domain-containing protein [Rhodoblastus acidophilus]|uniref:Transporter substrate-binding domain-containing protein n=1 Tax=Rhodoblastus acidophilus TaxID=1074 RepID=A0A6N8DI52_RHOAC|nr:transporter substrate-binding domain-containing protein [Rhodoblastus acidophilus]MCW2273258.1 polar amino acid transport system substrate-binding protein [Rhodoblastus acidophilus]MTV30152.1 transporter substrate-binding domain-containing protein [Rhodoblastus acidophilus]
MAVELQYPFIPDFLQQAKRAIATALIINVFLASGCILGPARAEGVFLPAFSDPHRRAEPPAQGKQSLRFLTSDDYPPFAFVDPEGALAGFNVEVARAICEQLQASCTIQPRHWETLLDALDAKEGDALIASIKPAAAEGRAIFTEPYYFTPARFVAVADSQALDVRPEGLADKKIGVEAGGAHEAFLRRFFPRAVVIPFDSREKMMRAVLEKQVDAGFGDAISLSQWMNETPGCAFVGGAWLEPAYFGEGVGVAVRPDDQETRGKLNWALQKLDESGKLAELYLKYFPVSIY